MQLLKKISWPFILFSPLAFHAQNLTEELIPWQDGRKLNWNDYYGKPDPRSDAAASTSTNLGVQFSFNNNTFQYKINCSFSKNKSWVLVKNDFILSHEQGHFDITKIFARKLNKSLSEYQFNRDSYRKDLDKIYQDITEEKGKMQDQYDQETDFSRNKEKQIEWLKKNEGMLKELQRFASYR